MSEHPGPYIRDNVIPQNMSVTKAAKLLGVGRPALSNLLNGNSSLSPEMAAKLERTFNANAKVLLDIQSSFTSTTSDDSEATANARIHVPPFLQIKANDIISWSDTHSSRRRLAVFLRTLTHSTNFKITNSSFPGNDDSELPGWDGFVDTVEATPWIPKGKSGWEFGVTTKIKGKADSDFEKSIAAHTKKECAEITFVFVTPRRWKNKSDWAKEQKDKNIWKDVRVYDAVDLEEWLEQSIPAQTWISHELGIPSFGVHSLDYYWEKWAADIPDQITPVIFNDHIERYQNKILEYFNEPEIKPLIISADSRQEGLAFLHSVLNNDDETIKQIRDKIIVFTDPNGFKKLTSKTTTFVPVIINPTVEEEFASHKHHLKAIIIQPRNIPNSTVNINVEPLNHETFSTALKSLGFDRDNTDRLFRESGGSLTVLRRRLSSLNSIKKPEWANNSSFANSLIPLLFSGAWDTNCEADKEIISYLSYDSDFNELEHKFAEILSLEDTPVWTSGSIHGMVSRIDTLFAIHHQITKNDIDRFFEVANLVLSEDNPALDLPIEEQWLAVLHKKSREISKFLRDGISEMLVLLSVHSGSLFDIHDSFKMDYRISTLINDLLSPITARKLDAHSSDLRMYAEASPDKFLDLLENDLNLPNPESLKLIHNASTNMFGRCPRSGLLWALEVTAWFPEHLTRTVDILAKLSDSEICDNWANRPSASLSSIFISWIPQTTCNFEQRVQALEYLTKNHPKIAWAICIEQLNGSLTTMSYSQKPRWRHDANGFGHGVSKRESNEFNLKSFDIILNWDSYSRDMINDIISCMNYICLEMQNQAWGLIEKWAENACPEDCAIVREKIRLCTMTRKAKKRAEGKDIGDNIDRVTKIYDLLTPNDIILKNAWLFSKQWIDESANELNDEDLNYAEREKRIKDKRTRALKDIYEQRGIEGVKELATTEESAGVIGWIFPSIFNTDSDLNNILLSLIKELNDSTIIKALLRNTLEELHHENKLINFYNSVPVDGIDCINEFLNIAPFRMSTWTFIEKLNADIQNYYWGNVHPRFMHGDDAEIQYMINKMMKHHRPLATLATLKYDIKNIPPIVLFDLLKASAFSAKEASDGYRIDSHTIKECFNLLNISGVIEQNDLASLEFLYISYFDREGGMLPNLENQISSNPELFIQAIAFAYKRKDGQEDPDSFKLDSIEDHNHRARMAYELLERLSKIPGTEHDKKISVKKLKDWINAVRQGSIELSRIEVCDINIGKLLSKSEAGEDGIWPSEEIREVIEEFANEDIISGITTGLYNSRGMVWRGNGGEQEREIANRYESWAKAVEISHPKVSQLLRQMTRTYIREAKDHDNEEAIRRRLNV